MLVLRKASLFLFTAAGLVSVVGCGAPSSEDGDINGNGSSNTSSSSGDSSGNGSSSGSNGTDDTGFLAIDDDTNRDNGGVSGTGENCGPNLTGIVRDFLSTHPDFEFDTGEEMNLGETGLVLPDLDSSRKPVYAGIQSKTTTTAENFTQWYNDTPDINQSLEYTITFTDEDGDGIATYENANFFPIDGEGFGNELMTNPAYGEDKQPPHNFHFTFELHTEFIYNGGEVFTFTGDDDLWVFINNKLAIDLGGLHNQTRAEVALDDAAEALGLTKGQIYRLELFHAERHTWHSHFRVDSSINFTNCGEIIR